METAPNFPLERRLPCNIKNVTLLNATGLSLDELRPLLYILRSYYPQLAIQKHYSHFDDATFDDTTLYIFVRVDSTLFSFHVVPPCRSTLPLFSFHLATT